MSPFAWTDSIMATVQVVINDLYGNSVMSLWSVNITMTGSRHCREFIKPSVMTSSTMKRLLIYYWYNVRWSRLLILVVVIGVAGILYGPQLFGSQSRPNYLKSKYGVARYKVIFSEFSV